MTPIAVCTQAARYSPLPGQEMLPVSVSACRIWRLRRHLDRNHSGKNNAKAGGAKRSSTSCPHHPELTDLTDWVMEDDHNASGFGGW